MSKFYSEDEDSGNCGVIRGSLEIFVPGWLDTLFSCQFSYHICISKCSCAVVIERVAPAEKTEGHSKDLILAGHRRRVVPSFWVEAARAFPGIFEIVKAQSQRTAD